MSWTIGGQPVSSDDNRITVAVTDNGLAHTLTISDISMDESGPIAAEVDDNLYGMLTSNCTITVKGSIS